MCGRFTVTSEQKYLEDRFSAKFAEKFSPRFNAAPSQKLPIITNFEPKKIELFSWGLRPDWWKKMKGRRDGIINIRMETLRDKWSFAKDLKNQRCLVLADGFFEWKKVDGKQPYRIVLKNEDPFAMAGIWEKNTDGATEIFTFSIITCEANKKLGEIHDRMPVILDKKEEKFWLGNNPKIWIDLLNSYPSNRMKMYPVSKEVNVPANDYPEILQKVDNTLVVKK